MIAHHILIYTLYQNVSLVKSILDLRSILCVMCIRACVMCVRAIRPAQSVAY